MFRDWRRALVAANVVASVGLIFLHGLQAVAQTPPPEPQPPPQDRPATSPSASDAARRATQEQPGRAPQDRAASDAARGQAPQMAPHLWGIEFREPGSTVVASVEPKSAAAQAGVQPGDRILFVDGRRVGDTRRLAAMARMMQEETLDLIVDRQGREISLEIKPSNEHSGWLGVYLEDADTQDGAKITHVYPAGPAARAGLMPGDVVVRVNEKDIARPSDLAAYVEEQKPGAKVAFQIKRGNSKIEANAVIGDRSPFFAHAGAGGEEWNEGGYGGDVFDQMNPEMMRLEHERRMAEQHQRIEEEIQKLREEVRLLREALQQPGGAPRK